MTVVSYNLGQYQKYNKIVSLNSRYNLFSARTGKFFNLTSNKQLEPTQLKQKPTRITNTTKVLWNFTTRKRCFDVAHISKQSSVTENVNHFKSIKGELKSKAVFSEMALKITLSSILTAEIFNHF